MILALHTATPNCRMMLLADDGILHEKKWLAERRLADELLGEIESFLHENNVAFENLDGLAVFRGPGSYTGLRIGISVMNALSYGLTIPIAGELGDNWFEKSRKRLAKGDNETIVIPEYGGLPNVTLPKK